MQRTMQTLIQRTVIALAVIAGAAQAETAWLETEKTKLKIETIASGLAHPWGMTMLPDGSLLVTERDGRLRSVSPDGQISAPITGLPAMAIAGQGGLLDILADKNFASNKRIYFSYSEPAAGNTSSTAVASAILDGQQLNDLRVLFSQQPKVDSKYHFGGRLVQTAEGTLFITLGDRGSERQQVQKLDTTIGKVVHITADGQPASGNPFIGNNKASALVWSYGHRNIQGATLDNNGRLWTHEHGPQGGDEINIAVAGKNYGWPLITYGEEYGGGVIGKTSQDGLEQPLHYWVPSIAPSGMVFYQTTLFAPWQHNLLVGSLKFGQLVRLEIKQDKVVHEERIRLGKRIRDIEVAPDGALLLLTDEDNGALLRLTPAT